MLLIVVKINYHLNLQLCSTLQSFKVSFSSSFRLVLIHSHGSQSSSQRNTDNKQSNNQQVIDLERCQTQNDTHIPPASPLMQSSLFDIKYNIIKSTTPGFLLDLDQSVLPRMYQPSKCHQDPAWFPKKLMKVVK